MRVSINEKLEPPDTSRTSELTVLPIENVESPSTAAKLAAVQSDADLDSGSELAAFAIVELAATGIAALVFRPMVAR